LLREGGPLPSEKGVCRSGSLSAYPGAVRHAYTVRRMIWTSSMVTVMRSPIPTLSPERLAMNFIDWSSSV